jgi:hypothetical protein
LNPPQAIAVGCQVERLFGRHESCLQGKANGLKISHLKASTKNSTPKFLDEVSVSAIAAGRPLL